MENLKRRGLSFLLALVMIVSLFAGVRLPEASAAGTVDYVYSGDYVYNWGTRGTTATYLSPKAEIWWSTKTAYSDLKEMSGSSNLDTVSTSALYIALADIMTEAHTTKTTYDGTRTLYQYTDCQESNTSKLSLLYLGKTVSSTWDSGKTFNREHTWPNSLSTSGSDSTTTRESDIMILYAADPTENSTRNNHPYGEGTGYYDPLYGYNGDNGTNTKRSLNVRGDVARAILYVYVRYGTDASYNDGALNYMWAEDGGVFQSLDTLLSWMESDPVDTWEMGRNDAVSAITGTRNVFVDYPELAFLLFNEEVPANYTSPSGGQDVAVESYTVTFKENGATTNTLSGSSVTLPQPTKTPDGYKFEGWVEAEVDKAESKPTVYAAGASYIPSNDTTLYALYSYTETTSGGSTTSQTCNVDISSYATSKKWENGTQYTEIDLDGSGNVTATANGGGNTGKYYDSGTNWRLYQTENATLTISSSIGTIQSITITYTSSNYGILTYNGTTITSGSATEINANSATFTVANSGTDTSGQARVTAIEVVIAGTSGTTTKTYYTTATCKHANTSTVTTPASCTEAGSTTVTCDDCSTVISETTIPATGHNYVDGTCTDCGNSEPAESVQVVIYAPEYMMALSSTYSTESTNYNAGVEVTVSGSSVTGYDSTEVWTLADNGDGTYSILYGNQHLCLSDSYTSMALCDPADDTVTHHHNWEIIPVGENLYNIRNTTRTLDGNTGYCIEWYAGNNYYCAYKTDTPYSNKNYQLSFHVVSGTLPTFTCAHNYVITTERKADCLPYTEEKLCSKCGDEQTTDYPASAEHNWVAGTVTPPTAVDQGYTTYSCPVCGSTKMDDYTDPVAGTDGCTVTFVVPAGVNAIAPMVSTTEGITLPTPGIPSADYEYTFAGWATSTIDNSTTVPTLYTGNYAPTADITLYAVYTYAPVDNVFTLVESTEDLVIGNEIVITANDLSTYPYAMGAQKSSNRGAGSVTVVSDTTITIGEDVQVFVLYGGTVANTYAFKSDDGYLYAAGSSSNYLKSEASIGTNSSWAITIDTTTFAASVVATASSNRNIMRFNYNNGSPLFACYASASQQALSLYTKSATVLTYTTEITRTESYDVTFSTPEGVASIPDTICGKTGITLPTAGVPYNTLGYAFVGWSTTTYEKATSKPTMYYPGEVYYATANTTFYAVYEYTTTGGGTSEYVLTDIGNISASDSVVITMTTNDGTTYALTNGNGTSAAPAATTVTVSGNKLAENPADTLKWNIGGTKDQYIIYPEGNTSNWLYCTNVNNGVRVGTNTSKTFEIDATSGYLKHSGTSRYLGIYTTNPDWRCYTSYTTANIANQTLGFYVKSSGATHYTTEVEVAEPPALEFSAASLEVSEGISINFKVSVDLFTESLYDLESAVATFVFNKGTANERSFTTNDYKLSTDGKYYVFQLNNIRPDWMGDTVSATLTAKLGDTETTSAVKEYSVATYCYNILNDATYQTEEHAELRTLLVNMLNYGAAAQIRENYKTDALVTDNDAYTANASQGTTGTPADLDKTPIFGTELTDPAATFHGAALYLRETVRIRLRFSVESLDGVTVTAQIGDGTPIELTDITSAGNGSYYVFFDNLVASQMRQTVTFQVMKNGEAISNSLGYSIDTYASGITQDGSKFANMINAMIHYGDAVYAYAN